MVYVSGRKRAEGEMNGKSGNINNCCSQIYPKCVAYQISCSDSMTWHALSSSG